MKNIFYKVTLKLVHNLNNGYEEGKIRKEEKGEREMYAANPVLLNSSPKQETLQDCEEYGVHVHDTHTREMCRTTFVYLGI